MPLTQAEAKWVTWGEERMGDNYVCVGRVGDILGQSHGDVQ